jgi:CRISPR-associated endonuclease/helicase Cas3
MGRARPFAPYIDDLDPPGLALETLRVTLGAEERRRAPAHALDSGIAERFWQLNRALGPWALAWIETVLRLADQVASENPGDHEPSSETRHDRELQLS